MDSPAPTNEVSSSRQDNTSTSNLHTRGNNLSNSNPQNNFPHIKTAEELTAWASARQHLPPHREKIERAPGDTRKNPGGPIRITMTSDGVLTEYGEKLERERLARLAATNQDKEGEPSCE